MTVTDSQSGRLRLFRHRGFPLFFLHLILLIAVTPAASQETKPAPRTEPPPESNEISEFGSRPIFLNINVFQLEMSAGTNPDLTDQVFRMRSSSLQDYDKWTRAFSKTYPGHKVSLLKLERRRA
ncbi:MAG: hypothetical protein ACOYLF_06930, partial [Blastocatellia bacterium]